MAIVMKRVAVSDLTVDATDSEVHAGKAPGRVIGFLAVNTDVAELAAVRRDELFRLHEHARGAVARIVHPAFVGFEYLDQ